MALGFKYVHSEFKSDQGTLYVMEIYDAEGSIALNYPVTCGPDGFTITYEGRGKKRYEYIKASKCSFQLNVPNASHPLQALIDNLAGSEQGRYKIKIKYSINNGVSYTNYWHGVITPDIVERQDISYPYFMDFQASDGLALMRDVPFNKDVYNGTNGSPTTLYTFANVITNMLEYYNPTTDFFDQSTETFLFESTHWYEDSMPTPAQNISPLLYAAIYPNAFMGLETDDSGEEINTDPLTAYEVLEQCMKVWGCRIVQVRGYWFMCHLEMYNHLNSSTVDVWYRRLNVQAGVLGTGELTFSGQQQDLGNATSAFSAKKLSGSIYSQLPKIQEVRARYGNWTSSGLKGDSDYVLDNWPGTGTAISLSENLGYAVAVAGAGINITHRLRARRQAGGSFHSWDLIKAIYILKVGNNYWNGSEWVSYQASFSTSYFTATTLPNSGYADMGAYPQFATQTDPFPTSGDILFSAWYAETNWAAGGNNFQRDYDIKVSATSSSYPSSVQYSVNGQTEVDRTFSSSDDTTISNSIENLGELLVGDGPTNNTPSWGRIRINDGSNWLNTVEENWQAWEDGTEARITAILCEQTFQGQREFTPLNNYNITFIGNLGAAFHPGKFLRDTTNGNQIMVMNGYKYNARRDELTGEFWKATSDSTGITNVGNVNNFLEVTYSPNNYF